MKFAQSELDSGEVAKDEVMVKELAQFLKNQAITKLVRDLQAVEGVPTDSESLEQTLHAHGVNVRYIGQIHALLEGKELHHLKTLLQREALVRSAKHIFNECLREVTDTHLAPLLAHLFNLLLAPFPLFEKMEEGSFAKPVAQQAEAPSHPKPTEESYDGKEEK